MLDVVLVCLFVCFFFFLGFFVWIDYCVAVAVWSFPLERLGFSDFVSRIIFILGFACRVYVTC
jgi:hypothetical protein